MAVFCRLFTASKHLTFSKSIQPLLKKAWRIINAKIAQDKQTESMAQLLINNQINFVQNF